MTLDESIELWQKEHKHEIVHACNMGMEVHEIVDRVNHWCTGTPSEEGDYLVAFRMSDNSVEYGWCNWNNGAWDILCDYDPTDGSCGMIAWQKIEPCNWFDFLFSEGHRDNWREVR